MWLHFLEFELLLHLNSLSILADSQKPGYPIPSYEYPPKAPLIWQYDILLGFLPLWTPLPFKVSDGHSKDKALCLWDSTQAMPMFVFWPKCSAVPAYIYLQSDMEITLQCLLKIFFLNQKLSTRKKSWRFQYLY